MIVRDARRVEHDLGPSPITARRVPGGSIAVPRGSAPAKPRERTFDIAEWKRAKRATDPEWAARERERERARYARRRAS